ncbi:DUF432 domain-containing protein [Methanochimaera problematica]|uniref:DUF432 domain-containing protein n=1 Tax=Methanochimaera problematica TaxID=2609417 RepID=UPI00293925DC|nr:DUF432 domain-containing protein [Methanoplanus sp. FWC-SCC4]
MRVSVSDDDGVYLYRRNCCNDQRIVKLSSPDGEVIVNPVEPVNLPKTITRYLEIEFDTIYISPESEKQFFLKYPVEIGSFLRAGKTLSIIDIFSLVPQKYSLYGSPVGGVIVRWYNSCLYTKVPETDPLREGVISLLIINPEKEIAEISRVVFDSYAMKIYYNDFYVTMSAEMKIFPKNEAETIFHDVPIIAGSAKSYEFYLSKKIPVVRNSFRMEWGY